MKLLAFAESKIKQLWWKTYKQKKNKKKNLFVE